MNYILKSGAKVEGTTEQIIAVCKSMGESVDLKQLEGTYVPGFYYSDSKKSLLKISEMNEMYLRNALLKQSKEHFEGLGLKKTLTNKEFLIQYTSLTNQPVVIELFTELSKRR